MTYHTAESMKLTRNCIALTASDAVEPIGFLKIKLTYPNGCSSLIDLATGIVTPVSAFKQRKHNKRNDDPDSYVYTPVYFDNPDPLKTESIYRNGRVHILNSLLSAYHRDLFRQALYRASEQAECDLSAAIVEVHHLNRNRQNNSVINLLPVTPSEHDRIHNALYKGASTYESLIYALGEDLVHSIFGYDYFAYGDCSVFTSKMHGVPYTQLMLHQLSAAHLPADTTCLRVKLLNGKYANVDITGLNIYEVLSALYLKSAIEIQVP